jgi:hypothetical protein
LSSSKCVLFEISKSVGKTNWNDEQDPATQSSDRLENESE